MFGGKCPEPNIPFSRIENLDDIENYLNFNCLEVNKAFQTGRHKGMSTEEILWLSVYLLFETKESNIEALMALQERLPITMIVKSPPTKAP